MNDSRCFASFGALGYAAPSFRRYAHGGECRWRHDDRAPTRLCSCAFRRHVVVRAGLDRQTDEENGLAALTAETMLRIRYAGRTRRRYRCKTRLQRSGGSVRFTVDPR